MQGTQVRSLSGEIPQASEQLSLCATTTQAQEPGACILQREVTSMRSLRTAMKSSPYSMQPEKARAAMKTNCSQKLKKKKKKTNLNMV